MFHFILHVLLVLSAEVLRYPSLTFSSLPKHNGGESNCLALLKNYNKYSSTSRITPKPTTFY